MHEKYSEARRIDRMSEKSPVMCPSARCQKGAVLLGLVVDVANSGDTQTVTLTVPKYWKGARGSSVTLINGIDPEGSLDASGGSDGANAGAVGARGRAGCDNGRRAQ